MDTQKTVQISDYFLCATCENRFNARGEKWTLGQCYRGPGKFRLQQTLMNAAPIDRDDGGIYYDGRQALGIRLDHLGYFAISVFWRMAARNWHCIDHTQRLDLGDHQETLRLFLIDAASFPSDAALSVFVSPKTRPLGWTNAPVIRPHKSPFLSCTFNIPGVMFMLSFGENLPSEVTDYCVMGSPKGILYLTDYVDDVARFDCEYLIKRHREIAEKKGQTR